MICMDSSDWMRNGDFVPTRLEAQRDAINLVCGTKIHSNPENTVGLMSITGRREVLVTLTTDMGKILTSLHSVKLDGAIDFLNGLSIAQLALKHRQSKNHSQRIIVFVGSPILQSQKEIVNLAKRLKKIQVNVDVVNFGEEESNNEKLEAFINAVNREDPSTKEATCRLITVPSGTNALSDAIISSPILGTGGSAGGNGGAGGGGFAEYGGVDYNADPELALALRVSMEEERARQQRTTEEAGTSGPGVVEPMAVDLGLAGSDPELAAALAFSLQDMQDPVVAMETTEAVKSEAMDEGELSEEDQIALALKMSIGEADLDTMDTSEDSLGAAVVSESDTATPKKTKEQEMSEALADPNFLNSVLMGLPGVDPNDEQIQSVLASLKQGPKGGTPQKEDKQ